MPARSAQTHRADWDDLRFVLAVARSGSVAAAARTLRVNHTTVLRRLAAYEGRLGARLFERDPTGYVPTPAGEVMMQELAALDAAIHDAERRAAGHDQRLVGKVRISTTDTLMASLLPGVLAGIRARHPGIVLDVSTSNSFAVLRRREADIAVRPAAHPGDELRGRKVGPVPFAAYASPSYLAGRPEGSPPADHAWLVPDRSLGETVAARWLRENLPMLEAVAEADSFVSLRDLAAAGMGVTLLPRYLGDPSHGLARVPNLRDLDLGSALWLLTHRDLQRVARIEAVLSALHEALRGFEVHPDGPDPRHASQIPTGGRK